MVTILRKEGWVLNPNDKIVNGVLKMIEKNLGVAQQVESLVWDQDVVGSSPVTQTNGDEKPWGKVTSC